MANGRGFGMDEGETQDREILELLDEMKERIGPNEPRLLTPPASLWAGIEQALSADGALGVVATADEPAVVTGPDTSTVTTSLVHHRKRRRPVGALLGSIAAAVIVAVAVGQVLDETPTTVGEAEVAALETGEELGTATVLSTDDGQELQMTLDVALAPAKPGEFFELWIIDPAVEEMYSLGQISGDGTFAVPAGVDVADFPIVDISLEPDDGDPTHSGASVYRGHL